MKFNSMQFALASAATWSAPQHHFFDSAEILELESFNLDSNIGLTSNILHFHQNPQEFSIHDISGHHPQHDWELTSAAG
jgi:hypothetical protein